MSGFDDDIAAVGEIDAVPRILEIVCRTTGMGFAAVARVTDDRWIACEIRDEIGFGLAVGIELPIETTLCSTVRRERKPVAMDAAAEHPVYRDHATPALYGFQSYVSVPIVLKDGTFFGTLCALDRKAARVDDETTRGMFALFAELIASHLQANRRFNESVRQQRDVEERLRQSQKMEAVGQMTGGLAHDFNNLLTGIVGSLDLMQLRLAQGRVHEIGRYVVAAQGAARRATALTQRLLAFSRRQPLTPVVTDVDRLVAGMGDLISRSIGSGIDFRVVASPDLWPVRVDQNQLENALLNLCINARDAMPAGGTLTVSTANGKGESGDGDADDDRAASSDDVVSLTVADTGQGMSPEVLARAFEPFFTTKPSGRGTGLGLSMVYGFAQQSGGKVRILSEVDVGTRITIDLPRHDGDDDPIVEDLRLVEPATDEARTVLVVDDEPSVRMLIADLLVDMGHTALEAGDATAALDILASSQSVALLVTDIGLPGDVDGRELAAAARKTRPELKVLFVSGHPNAARAAPPSDFRTQVATKPFLVETLGRQIREFLER